MSKEIRARPYRGKPPKSYTEYPDRRATLYAIQSGPLIKIGLTTKPGTRALDIVGGAPHHQAEVLCLESVPYWCRHEAESIAHLLLKDRRHRGEWFRVGPGDAVSAVRSAIKIMDKRRARYEAIWAERK